LLNRFSYTDTDFAFSDHGGIGLLKEVSNHDVRAG